MIVYASCEGARLLRQDRRDKYYIDKVGRCNRTVVMIIRLLIICNIKVLVLWCEYWDLMTLDFG